MIRLQQAVFKEPTDTRVHDDEPIVVHAKKGRITADLVLFVHGLTGHRYGYWGNIPRFVLEDLPTAEIGLYFYRTALRRLGLFKSIDLEGEARVLADALRQLREYEAVVLVGHSMGGLLSKAAIVDLVNRGHWRTLRRISGLVLLASPQLGSLRVPRLLRLLSADGRALFPHNEAIQRIDSTFAARLAVDQRSDPLSRFSIPTWAVVAAHDFWVDALSAGIGIPEEQKLTVRGTHSSIIQPSSKDASSYVFLRECLDASLRPPAHVAADAEDVQVEDARPDDVQGIRKLAVSFFGEGVTPENVLADFAAAGGILRVVKRVVSSEDERRERFAGYFCVIPLSAEAAASVRSCVLRGGALTMNHLPAAPAETEALYIGAVAARDHYSRAVVLEALRLHVRYAVALGVSEILTRPLTRDGLRLVRKYGFRPVRDPGGLDQLYQLGTRASAAEATRQSNSRMEPTR